MDFQGRWPPRQYDASYPEQNFQLKCQMFKNIRFLSSATILTSMCWDCVSSLSALFCVHVCFCMCVHMLGPEVSVGYLPVSFSTLLQRSLTELRADLVSQWTSESACLHCPFPEITSRCCHAEFHLHRRWGSKFKSSCFLGKHVTTRPSFHFLWFAKSKSF